MRAAAPGIGPPLATDNLPQAAEQAAHPLPQPPPAPTPTPRASGRLLPTEAAPPHPTPGQQSPGAEPSGQPAALWGGTDTVNRGGPRVWGVAIHQTQRPASRVIPTCWPRRTDACGEPRDASVESVWQRVHGGGPALDRLSPSPGVAKGQQVPPRLPALLQLQEDRQGGHKLAVPVAWAGASPTPQARRPTGFVRGGRGQEDQLTRALPCSEGEGSQNPCPCARGRPDCGLRKADRSPAAPGGGGRAGPEPPPHPRAMPSTPGPALAKWREAAHTAGGERKPSRMLPTFRVGELPLPLGGAGRPSVPLAEAPALPQRDPPASQEGLLRAASAGERQLVPPKGAATPSAPSQTETTVLNRLREGPARGGRAAHKQPRHTQKETLSWGGGGDCPCGGKRTSSGITPQADTQWGGSPAPSPHTPAGSCSPGETGGDRRPPVFHSPSHPAGSGRTETSLGRRRDPWPWHWAP